MKRRPNRPDSADRDLGLDLPITRRDFLDATLLAAGAGLLGAPAPLGQATPASNPVWDGFGGVGDYARSHGNMWSSIAAPHDLRDGKFGGGPRAAKRSTPPSGTTWWWSAAGSPGLGRRISSTNSAAGGA